MGVKSPGPARNPAIAASPVVDVYIDELVVDAADLDDRHRFTQALELTLRGRTTPGLPPNLAAPIAAAVRGRTGTKSERQSR